MKEAVFLSDEFRRPIGAYSPAVVSGDFVFVSGQVPRDLKTGELLGSDIESQTRGVLDNVKAVLGAAGCTLDDVVRVDAYIEDMGNWEAFDRIYRETFQPPYPTRTTVGVKLHGVMVEITAVARRR